MLTASGKIIDHENFGVKDIDWYDIIHALSMMTRYNGHTRKHYSVAEHCVLTSRVAWEMHHSIRLAQWGLIHDFPEAYVGDMIFGMKDRCLEFRDIEDHIMQVIACSIGLGGCIPPEIKYIDRAITRNEIEQGFYLGRTDLDKLWLFDQEGIPGLNINFWDQGTARNILYKEFDGLFDIELPLEQRIKLREKF